MVFKKTRLKLVKHDVSYRSYFRSLLVRFVLQIYLAFFSFLFKNSVYFRAAGKYRSIPSLLQKY